MALLLLSVWLIFGAYMQISLCHDPMPQRQRIVLAFLYWPLLFAQITEAFLINVFVLFGMGWKSFWQYRKSVEEQEIQAIVDHLTKRKSL